MLIKILGSGCRKCKKLEKNTRLALKDLQIEATVKKITDFDKIVQYGVMQTPALVINEEVIANNKLLTVKEIKKILKK